jgi:flagellar M-ring protein FliF
LTAATVVRERLLLWLGRHGGAVALVGVALLGLLLLRSIVRSMGGARPRAADGAIELPPSLSLVGDARDDAAPVERPCVPPTARRATLNSELDDLVRDDPEAAASVLRTWIGNAS